MLAGRSGDPGAAIESTMVIPLSIGLVGKDGRDLVLKAADGRPLEGQTIVLAERTARFEFADVGERLRPRRRARQ